MKKSVLIIFLASSLISCSLLSTKKLTYPSGIIFPIENAEEITYKGEIIDQVSRDGDNVYFSTRKGFVYCIDSKKALILDKSSKVSPFFIPNVKGFVRLVSFQNPAIIWIYESPEPLQSPVYLGRENIYVFDRENTLFCLDRKGSPRWEIKIEEDITSDILEFQDKVYFGTEKGSFYAINVANGEKCWVSQAAEAIRSNPVAAENVIMFGSDDQHLYFMNKEGLLIEKIKFGDKIQTSLETDGNSLYFGTDDHYFYCMDVKKRRMKWKAKVGGKVVVPPVTDRGRIYFLCWNSVLYCLDKSSGTIVWWKAVPSRSFYHLELIESRIVVSSLSSYLVCFEVTKGEQVGFFDATQEIKSNPEWIPPFLLINLYNQQFDQGSLVIMKKLVQAIMTPSLASPRKTNEEIVFNVSSTGFFMPQYEFHLTHFVKIGFNFNSFIYMRMSEDKEIVQEKSEKNTWNWFPEREGIYKIGILVEDEKEKAEAETSFLIERVEPQASLTSSKESPQKPKEEIEFVSSSQGFTLPQYQFSLSRMVKVRFGFNLFVFLEEKREVVQEKSDNNVWTWIPEEEGIYVIRILIEDETEEDEAEITFLIEREKTQVILSSSKEPAQKTNEEIVFTASAQGFSIPKYEFFLGRLDKVCFGFNFFIFIEREEAQVVQEGSEQNTWAWQPEEEGIYRIKVITTEGEKTAETEMLFLIEK